MTLEEYRNSKKAAMKNPNARAQVVSEVKVNNLPVDINAI
jgi:hypothetical protein